jgi:hypothetical protein
MERRKQLQANLRQPSDALLEWEAVAQWLRNDAVIGELQRVLAREADAYLEWAAYACTSVWPPVQAAQILLAYPPAELFQVSAFTYTRIPICAWANNNVIEQMVYEQQADKRSSVQLACRVLAHAVPMSQAGTHSAGAPGPMAGGAPGGMPTQHVPPQSGISASHAFM